MASDGNYVFRGYNKQDQLLPNIIRNKVTDLESDLLFEFERYGSQYVNTSNPIDFMSYAQHFGLSTRLLDFTYNPFIALYFSLFVDKSNGKYKYNGDKIYYYIRYCNVNENILIKHVPIFNKRDFFEINSMAKQCNELFETIDMMFNINHQFIQPEFMNKDIAINNFFGNIVTRTNGENPVPYIDGNINKIDNRKLLLIDPNQSNQRLIMQQGLFMFPYILDENEHIKLIHQNTQEIRIHKDLREELLSYLDTLGINAFRIMPDLTSVCKAVERKTKEKRNSKSELFKRK